jgi:hypothetical protein
VSAGLIGEDFLSGQLYDMNTATGAATNPRGSGATSLAGIAFAPSGTLFGLTTFGGAPANSLVTINPTTGIATLVGATGLTAIIEGDLAFDPITGFLYGLYDVVGPNYDLFRINPATGAATTIGAIANVSDFSAMAFNAAGVLFVVNNGDGKLLTVNTATAAILSTVNLSPNPGGEVAGLAIDPSTGVFYYANGYAVTSNLYTLDTSTGVLTLIGPAGQTNFLAGLAFTPVPEPATTTLFVLGASVVGLLRRRRSALPISRHNVPLGLASDRLFPVTVLTVRR